MMKKMKKKRKISLLYIILFVVLAAYVLSMLVLLLWGFLASVKPSGMRFNNNILGLPEGAPWDWQWKNYTEVFKQFSVPVKRVIDGTLTRFEVGFGKIILYTVLYAGVGAVISGVVPMAVAYATSKFDCFISKFIYSMVVIILILPIIGAQASELAILHSLNLHDTFMGAWMLKFNFSGMYFLVFYATFKGISKEYTEAAYIDGASEWAVFFRIMLPFAKVILSTVILLRFIDFWNDYQVPLLYIPSHPTLAYSVWQISNNPKFYPPHVMATCFVVMIPILIIFMFAKDKLMGNLSMGGVKE